MSVSLTLLPRLGPTIWASHTVLYLNDWRELFDEVRQIPTHAVPEPLSCYMARDLRGERAYGEIVMDDYHEPLQWVPAGDLARLVPDGGWRNDAAWAYLRAMPADWPVVLFWH